MVKTANDFKRKSVSFDNYSTEDVELFRELQKLPHGDFSRITKEMWLKRLRGEKK